MEGRWEGRWDCRGSNLRRRDEAERKRIECMLIDIHLFVCAERVRRAPKGGGCRQERQKPAALSQAALNSPNLSELLKPPAA